MNGFEIYRIRDWLVEGIFMTKGSARGPVEVTKAVVAGAAIAAASSFMPVAYGDAYGTSAGITVSAVKRTSFVEVDPDSWGRYAEALRQRPLIEESPHKLPMFV